MCRFTSSIRVRDRSALVPTSPACAAKWPAYWKGAPHESHSAVAVGHVVATGDILLPGAGGLASGHKNLGHSRVPCAGARARLRSGQRTRRGAAVCYATDWLSILVGFRLESAGRRGPGPGVFAITNHPAQRVSLRHLFANR